LGRGRNRRRMIILAIVGTVVLAGASYGVWRLGNHLLVNSRWARFESAEVTGLSRVPKKTVLKAANLKPGMNIMRLPYEAISDHIGRIPGVRSARVAPKIPYRVAIEVEERRPIACIQLGRFQFVDEQAVIFPTTGPSEVIDLPVLTGEVDPRNQPRGFAMAVEFVAKVREAYPTVYSHLGEVSVRGGKIEMRLREGGAVVRAGNPSSPAALVKLEQFLIQRGDELNSRSQYVDLRYPAMIVTGTEG